MHFPRVVAFLVLCLSTPLFAYERGNVLFGDRAQSLQYGLNSQELWLEFGGDYAVYTGGVPLIFKPVPFGVSGNFLIPRKDLYVFHHDREVAFWDGHYRPFVSPEPAYTSVFHATADLGEIAPMRSGNFLVPEIHGTKLIEFNARGVVTEYAFPGATHIELLADQCTLLYTRGDGDAAVHRFDLCARKSLPDFAALQPGQYAGSIRQLPNGDVLVANGNAVLHFTQAGSLLRSYPLPNVTRIALTPDASAFWAAGVYANAGELRRVELQSPFLAHEPVPLGNPGSQSIYIQVEATDLVVVGEWRASAAAQPRGRAARH
ncbi:MAG TPA: hypothetical protein VKB93_23615 [Thermoanaerobaculia bacterium]|nr:hypothetical protein [Thermoanaerobaculia bacterium]